MEITKDLTRHPCFNKASAGSCGRVHLPVAPKCNIKCNYCDRKYDCVNESRPGVSSAVLSPPQALRYMETVLEKEPRITVAGIAGPGDPFANPIETLQTMRLLKKKYPHLIFCLSSNGLGLPAHLDDLVDVGVSHVTVTMNAVDPEIGRHIYKFVRDGKVVYRGLQAAEVLLSRQLEAIRGLKERGLVVKVNTIVIPGVNDHHVTEVSKTASALGADIQNLIPLHPTANTPFGELTEPTREQINDLRSAARVHVPQMTHCQRCRADAVGLLCKDRSGGDLGEVLRACAQETPSLEEARPYVAVATREGMLVNQHLGETRVFQIWEKTETGYNKVEDRQAPTPGCGPKRWLSLAHTLQDCRAVLASAIGETPAKTLLEHNITPHACAGFIETALDQVYTTNDLKTLKGRSKSLSQACCGTGGGCG